MQGTTKKLRKLQEKTFTLPTVTAKTKKWNGRKWTGFAKTKQLYQKKAKNAKNGKPKKTKSRQKFQRTKKKNHRFQPST